MKYKGRPISTNIEDRRSYVPRNDYVRPDLARETHRTDADNFLVDSFKSARKVGLPMDWNKFGLMVVPWEGDGWMPAANEIKAGGFNQQPATYASHKVHTYPQLEDLKTLTKPQNNNARIWVVK